MTITLTSEEARAVALNCEFPSAADGMRNVHGVVSHLGSVQIDTISITERSHHHILWSRIPGYEKFMLDEAVQEGSVFEYWGHAAAYLPMEHFRFTIPRKNLYKRRYSAWSNANSALIRRIMSRIKEEGPLSSRDFEGKAVGPAVWWNHKPAKQALEVLFHSGRLMASKRVNFIKFYDLAERVIPAGTDVSPPSEAELCRHIILSAIKAHGIVSDSDIVYLRRIDRKIYKQTMNELQEENMVADISISGGSNEIFRSSPLIFEGERKKISGTLILSPFDNSVIRRSRLLKIHGYEYSLECYLSAGKRKHGYFCLPVLSDGMFIGSIDCKADRKNNVFSVLSINPHAVTRSEFKHRISEAVQRFAYFTKCNKVKFT